MTHRINECRYLCSELVSVLYEDRSGNIHQVIANLEEISSATSTLLAEQNLESGLRISFRAKNHDLYGVVESNAFDPTLGWFIKIKLDQSSQSHERLFVPQHFIPLGASGFSGVTEVVTTRVPLRRSA